MRRNLSSNGQLVFFTLVDPKGSPILRVADLPLCVLGIVSLSNQLMIQLRFLRIYCPQRRAFRDIEVSGRVLTCMSRHFAADSIEKM